MRRISLLLFLLTISGSAFAQGAIDTVLLVGDAMVVARLLGSDATPSQRLAGKELQRLNSLSVADAVRYFSGVQVKDYGGIGGLKTVNVRSLGSRHTGVFYDGVQLGNAQNGQVDLGRFSMDNMEAIELYNGRKGNIFQTAKDYSSASAVYLQTRRPVFADGRRDNLKLSFKAGSFGTTNPAMLWEHRLNKRLDAQVSAEYLYTSGRYRFTYAREDGYRITDTRRNGDVNAARIEGGLFGRLTDGDWKAKLYFYDSQRGYPGASVREDPGRFRNEGRQWDRNFFAQSSLRRFFGLYSLMLNAKYANDYLHYLDEPDDGSAPADNRFLQQELYFSAVNGFKASDRWRISLSTDYQYNTLDAFVKPSRHTVLAAAATMLDFGRFSAQASLLHTYIRDRTKTDGPADDKSRWTPTLAASWQISESLTLRAFYKNIFRMPTLNDNYYTLVGNPSLTPERATQYNLGATWEHRWLTLQADAYYNEVRDKIIAIPAMNQFRWTMLNLGYVEVRGVDVAATAAYGIFRARLNYTYQKAQDFTAGRGYYGGLIPYSPLHSGSAVVGATWREWDFNYCFVYTGERWEQSDNTPANYALPWYTSDMSLSRIIGRWRLAAEVNNIFDQQYEVVQCYPMPGINFKLKIEWTL